MKQALIVAVAGQAVGAALGLTALVYLDVIHLGPRPEFSSLSKVSDQTLQQLKATMYSCVGRKLDEDKAAGHFPARDFHPEYFSDLWSQCFHEEANRLAK